MSYYFEKIPLLENETFIIRDFEVPYIDFPLHYHLEYELNYVSNSFGMRYVGDHVGEFREGDLVLIGPKLPHQWLSSSEFKQLGRTSRSVVLQIHRDFLGKEFMNRTENQSIAKLMQRSEKGIRFYGDTRSFAIEKLEQLLRAKGFEGLILLLELFGRMADTLEYELLSRSTFDIPDNCHENDRIGKIMSWLAEHYDRPIRIQEIAEQFSISVSGLSHYFRKKTGKNITLFINELRIAKSCNMLISGETPVNEIAWRCGFDNLSYFNRMFKSLRNCTPREFRYRHGHTIPPRYMSEDLK